MEELLVDTENVARAIFEPSMIVRGYIIEDAFLLRPSIKENYISVVRLSIDSWKQDILQIPTNKTTRKSLYGYAEMNVGEIMDSQICFNNHNITFAVSACDNQTKKSHAGIFAYLDGEVVQGGVVNSKSGTGEADSLIKLLIQRKLVSIAQKGLTVL